MPGDNPLFVSGNYADLDPALGTGNSGRVGRIGDWIETGAEPAEAGTDLFPYRGATFADTTGKHQGVEPPSAAAREPISRWMR